MHVSNINFEVPSPIIDIWLRFKHATTICMGSSINYNWLTYCTCIHATTIWGGGCRKRQVTLIFVHVDISSPRWLVSAFTSKNQCEQMVNYKIILLSRFVKPPPSTQCCRYWLTDPNIANRSHSRYRSMNEQDIWENHEYFTRLSQSHDARSNN